MPTYEYECKKCGRIFEVFQSITARPKTKLAVDCERCQGQAPVRRLIGTGGALLFKGNGFYATDYRSESYKKAAKAESGGDGGDKGKSDSKSGGKAGKSVASGTESDAPSR
jgi:putative FmdB family regulatory protein